MKNSNLVYLLILPFVVAVIAAVKYFGQGHLEKNWLWGAVLLAILGPALIFVFMKVVAKFAR